MLGGPPRNAAWPGLLFSTLLTFLLQLGAEALLAKCQLIHETRKGMNVVEQAYADMHVRGTSELLASFSA